jgi:hypothetical protein
LNDGEWKKSGYDSQSEADLAYCRFVAGYTKDADVIDRMVRNSKLMREKWHKHPTYAKLTIKKALEGLSVIEEARRNESFPYAIGPKGNIVRFVTDRKSQVAGDNDGNKSESNGEGSVENVTLEGSVVVDAVIDRDGIQYYRTNIRNGAWSVSTTLEAAIWTTPGEFCKKLKGQGGDRLKFDVRNWQHLAHASEKLCSEKARFRTRDFGWDFEFLSFFGRDCVIDKQGIHQPGDCVFASYDPDTEKKIHRFRLAIPASNEHIRNTLQHIKAELMCFNSYQVQQLILGTVFVAPFGSLFRERAPTTDAVPSLIVQGTTGDGKSTMLMLAQCFFGHVRLANLPSFGDTPLSIPELGYVYRDSIFIVDDLKWGNLTPSEQAQVKKVLQNYTDCHGRGRLERGSNGKYTASSGKEIRGVLMIPSEDPPSGEASLYGRFPIAHLKERKVDDELLKRCVVASKDYSAVMSAFIHWYLKRNEAHEALLDMYDNYKIHFTREVAAKAVNASRVCSQCALNMIGYEHFIRFAESESIFTRERSNELISQHYERLAAFRDERLHEIKDETIAEKFLQMVKELVSTGRCHIEGVGSQSGINIGFVEEGLMYLVPGLSFGEVQKAFQSTGEKLPFTSNSLGEQLASRGYLAKTNEGRHQVQKRHNGKIVRCWAIDPVTLGFEPQAKALDGNQS